MYMCVYIYIYYAQVSCRWPKRSDTDNAVAGKSSADFL